MGNSTPQNTREYNPERMYISHALRSIPNTTKRFLRSLLALFTFILGFNFSNSAFFKEYPLFGVPYLAEIVISVFAAYLGYWLLPKIALTLIDWIEQVITRTINEIVSAFWEQQTRRIHEARREKQKQKNKEIADRKREEINNAILIDTSVLIDGRILEIVKTGFMDNNLLIPEEVINELHLLSDNKDNLKRQRGRRGLDIIKEIKKYVKVVNIKTQNGGPAEGVDKNLIKYAKENKTKLMTMDFNLNKVANVTGVKVLNINDLTNAVKTILIPGEIIGVKIIQAGKEREQGIGYLPDGTMLVVEKSKDKVGQEVSAKVAKVIQSSAGKIIFCDLNQ